LKDLFRSLRRAILLFLFLLHSVIANAQDNVATADRAMVATVHPRATDAALKIIADGGNAVDAALTAAITLGVVDGYNSGIGGGCFILIRTPKGQLFAIDGRETAPRKATAEMFYRDGKPDTELSQIGPLASGTPGAVAAYHLAWRKAGKLPWESHFKEAIRIAEDGFEISDRYARLLASRKQIFERFAGSRQLFIRDERTLAGGELLVQKDLARSLKGIAFSGPDYFYRGEVAQRISKWMADNDGVLSGRDLASYKAKLRSPVVSTYRDHTIVGFPPPSSGGIHVAQILNILEMFPVAEYYRSDPAKYTHVVSEAMKLAFADRAYWLGDADFTRVPQGLVSKEYARQLGHRIKLNEALAVESHGLPPARFPARPARHTTHIAVADKQGYWVAMTATVNTSFGSKVVIPATGIIMNNEMDDFALAPGVANAFGLLGSQANRVEPLKRPLSSMSPTIVMKDGQPILTTGAAGGPKIITSVLLGLSRVVDLGMSPADAISTPRFHHQWSPDRLYMERSNDERLIESMKKVGHQVYLSGSAGVSQMIYRDLRTGEFTGVSDPRTAGKAAGY
tara:strand:+ start:2459 stop:4162 length:1704 start_codon:yes stop_codon:yes gene_type:complete